MSSGGGAGAFEGRAPDAERSSRAPTMAASGCGARALEKLAAATLRLRAPAERVGGSLRSAAASWAVIVAGYSLVTGSMYVQDGWRYYEVATLVATTGAFSLISAIMNTVLLFGILTNEKNVLKYTLCAAMSVFYICIPLSVVFILGTAFIGRQICVWEVPRVGMCLLQLGLMYCLLVELRGETRSKDEAAPPPADGWLKNNLTHHYAPVTQDDELLKINMESTHGVINLGNGFLFTPNNSSTHAPTVHKSATSHGPPSSTAA